MSEPTRTPEREEPGDARAAAEKLEEAQRIVRSLAAMLGWGNTPPREALERSLSALMANECRLIDERDSLRAEVERLKRRLDFLESTPDDEASGWCGEHPRRFAVDAGDGDDGPYDECQKCLAGTLEAERDRWKSEHLRMTDYAEKLLAERDALAQENARLREALEKWARTLAIASKENP